MDNCSVRTRIDRTRCKALIKSDLPLWKTCAKATAPAAWNLCKTKPSVPVAYSSQNQNNLRSLFLHCATRAKKRQIYCRLGTPSTGSIRFREERARRQPVVQVRLRERGAVSVGVVIAEGSVSMNARIHNTAMKMGVDRPKVDRELPAALSGLARLGFYPGFRLSAPPCLHFSPGGEAKCVRGLSVRGTGRLARGGVLEQYGEHGRQP